MRHDFALPEMFWRCYFFVLSAFALTLPWLAHSQGSLQWSGWQIVVAFNSGFTAAAITTLLTWGHKEKFRQETRQVTPIGTWP